MTAQPIPPAWVAVLNAAFERCAAAGYGRTELLPDGGKRFEAYPGQEDAAADFLEALLIGRTA
ncbi:hypothetical protein [Trujillonella endophytica]|uniref:Uncharacterized protein n=1 Tax=Trujillonella endophytica TaxID=673521 RepID=A0A1H8UJQ4_9ACTN|nr:hypothetical protein [Trujillella endophytica]SEP02828.1 hypothetical protein SAMN05660991_02934 [Trujillella endophytica]